MTYRELLEAAYQAAENAYVPYSDYPVGAAILTTDGRVFTGCNVENSSYGATICAERVAATKAVSEGSAKFRAIAVVSKSKQFTPPCGVCRQFLSEFSEDLEFVFDDEGEILLYHMNDLLPYSFGKGHLEIVRGE
ncbi:MAG: cytidine deaminase [Bacillota bacterium]|nr:cytidine deaminase [Bacillota bacterium]